MRTTVNLREVTDRVLGLGAPRAMSRAGGPRGRDRALAAAMFALSATATLASLGLWIAGYGFIGLRVFAGTILLLLLVLRLR